MPTTAFQMKTYYFIVFTAIRCNSKGHLIIAQYYKHNIILKYWLSENRTAAENLDVDEKNVNI